MTGKLHDATEKFHRYRNLQRYHVVLPAIAGLSCYTFVTNRNRNEYYTDELQIYNFAITDVSPHDLIKPKPHKTAHSKV